jgi:hypothetical protein
MIFGYFPNEYLYTQTRNEVPISYRGYPPRVSWSHRILESHNSGRSRKERLGLVTRGLWKDLRSYQRCGVVVAEWDGRRRRRLMSGP